VTGVQTCALPILSRGNVAVYHPAEGSALLVKAGDAAISPAQGFATQGEIAMVNDVVVVTAREGTLKVQSNGRTAEVTKGKTLSLSARASRSPDPKGGGAAGGGGGFPYSLALQGGSLGASGTATVLGGVTIGRAGDAKTLANQASSNAAGAASAANSVISAANGANSAANNAGCAVNAVNSAVNPGSASPFTPAAGTC